MKAIVRDPAIEKMEVALSLWIEDRIQKKGAPEWSNGPGEARNVSPIIPYKLPFRIHGFCIRGIFMEHIPREYRAFTVLIQ
uniref:Uncharacterized protein n=1 Tax=Rhodnius prolixus TaxID=13249 RepID=T1HS65_RHOPR